jgi:hypothetical protein
MTSQPTVWFVDDLPSNLKEFERRHAGAFHVVTFRSPAEVLRTLEKDRPDALLSDIFFYDTPERAEEIERKVNDEAEKLRGSAHQIGADRENCLAGIELIERVNRKYGGKVPFPVYAYTSKGPYLLSQSAWDRIIKSNAVVLLKNRFGPEIERMIISEHISDFRNRNKLYARILRHPKTAALATAALGWVVGKFLEFLWAHFLTLLRAA